MARARVSAGHSFIEEEGVMAEQEAPAYGNQLLPVSKGRERTFSILADIN